MNVPVPDVRAGDTDGPVVVCVHGGMDRIAAFARLRRRLHEAVPGVTTVAYDRRGYASSVHLPVERAFERQIEDLSAVVDAALGGSSSVSSSVSASAAGSAAASATGSASAAAASSSSAGGRPLVVVGHSVGATIAMGWAARRPPRLVGLVLGEPPLAWLPWWPGSAGNSTLVAYERDGAAAAAESFMRRIVGDRVWERLPEATRQARRSEGEAIVADLVSLRAGGAPFAFTDVAVPAVALRGSRSPWHNRRATEYAAARLPLASLRVLDGAGHAVHSERPDDHVLAVTQLLEAARRP